MCHKRHWNIQTSIRFLASVLFPQPLHPAMPHNHWRGRGHTHQKRKGTGRTARAVANDQDLAPCFGPAQLRDMALGISNEGHQTQGPKRVPSGATAALKFVVARRHVPWLCADILRELYSISLNYLGVSSVATNRRKSSVAYGSKSRVP